MANTNEIISFWRKYGYHDISFDRLKYLIEEHEKFKTLEVVEINGEIAGVCRYNIDGDTCFCLDVVIRPKYRFKRMLKLMICKGLRKFPLTRHLIYDREMKDGRRRRFDIMKFIGVKHGR